VSTAKRVLLIEDEATLSLLLRERLEKEGYCVATCEDGEHGLAESLRGEFDLVLLDIKLPGRNGIDVCRELRRRSISVSILMLTARGDVKDRVRGLKAGADDYLAKPFDVSELLARMEAVLRRSTNSPPQAIEPVFCFGSVTIDFSQEQVLRDGVQLELTAKEFSLLRYFILNPNERLSREILLKEVWGYRQAINTRTIDLHVAQLRRKVEVDAKNPRHILTQFRSGYRFVPFP
jgi:two-component system alkaline phosphatase synthesis response regulator PhoP